MVLLLGCLYENIPPPHTPWYGIHNTLVIQEIISLMKACEVKKRQCKIHYNKNYIAHLLFMEGYQCQSLLYVINVVVKKNAVLIKKNAVFCKRSLKYPA